MSTTKVLYISGAPRSGTTVLGMALGQDDALCDVGELWALWRPAFRTAELCGCGRPVPDCEFWLSVASRALGPEYERRGREVGELHRRALGTGRAPRAWLHAGGLRPNPDLERYAEALGRHYRAIAERSGARVIVDSSKMATDALVASTLPDVELWLLHLVRDPRAMAWSWRRQVRQPGTGGRALDRRPPVASALRWDAYNLFAEVLLRPRLRPRFRSLRYEDFVARPRRTLQEILAWIGEPDVDVPVDGDPPALELRRPSHPVWGNPVRTATGPLPLRLDDEWRQRMPAADRLLTTLITFPLLRRYRYPVWPAPRSTLSRPTVPGLNAAIPGDRLGSSSVPETGTRNGSSAGTPPR